MMTDCIFSGLSDRLRAMAGKAVLTMVESSVCMNRPMATSQRSGFSDLSSEAEGVVGMGRGGGSGGVCEAAVIVACLARARKRCTRPSWRIRPTANRGTGLCLYWSVHSSHLVPFLCHDDPYRTRHLWPH